MHENRTSMVYCVFLCLIGGLVAAALGLADVAALATQISWILFLIGAVLLAIQLIRGKVPPLS